jgi:hypothetical protein
MFTSWHGFIRLLLTVPENGVSLLLAFIFFFLNTNRGFLSVTFVAASSWYPTVKVNPACYHRDHNTTKEARCRGWGRRGAEAAYVESPDVAGGCTTPCSSTTAHSGHDDSPHTRCTRICIAGPLLSFPYLPFAG